MQHVAATQLPLDVVVDVDGPEVTAELAVQNNSNVRIGDQYTVRWEDGTLTILRVVSFKSAEGYNNTIARRTKAMREGVAGEPQSQTAREAYQVKLAVLSIEGELAADGSRRIGASRVPNVMVPLVPITDDALEQFSSDAAGNIVLGNLRAGRRRLRRLAKIRHNYAGERMVIFGRPGMGKSQLARSILSQAMSDQ